MNELGLGSEYLLELPSQSLTNFNRQAPRYVNSAALLLDPRHAERRDQEFSAEALRGLVGLFNSHEHSSHTPAERPRFCCPSCQAKGTQSMMDFGLLHDTYRDPHFLCESCGARYRSDLTPLELDFAWRDGIRMPAELLKSQPRPKRRDLKRYGT